MTRLPLWRRRALACAVAAFASAPAFAEEAAHAHAAPEASTPAAHGAEPARARPAEAAPANAEPRARVAEGAPARAEAGTRPAEAASARAEPSARPAEAAPGHAEPRARTAEAAPAHGEPRARAAEPEKARAAESEKARAEPAATRAEAAAAPAARAVRTAPADPLEHVRELLTEKLGARQTSRAGGPYDVRVAARGSDAAAEARPARAAVPRRAAAEEPAGALAPRPSHWSYGGDAGPDGWARLSPEFAQCSSGSRQSPIDIRDGIAVQLEAIKFDYRPSGFSVVDNGHTVQVNVAPGNSIEILGRRFELQQFHFHRPSEERINGRAFDMVAHLVHKDAEGRVAVVAVLLDRGSAQPIVQAVWNNLPLEKNDELRAQAAIDLNQLLPEDRRYYTYMGSLTTPPCTEGVLWMVMKSPVPIAPEQIAVFSRLYPMNARPLQASSGRLIKESQ